MTSKTIDYIQIFSANFQCDIDLKIKPELGLSRRDESIKWPNLDKLFEKKEDVHYAEIRLRHSRYTIETINLVLNDPAGTYPQLEDGVLNCYGNDVKSCYAFDAAMVSLALEKMRLSDSKIDSNLVRDQYKNWLSKAIEKCRG